MEYEVVVHPTGEFLLDTYGTRGFGLRVRGEGEEHSIALRQIVRFNEDLSDFKIDLAKRRIDAARAFIYSRETLVMEGNVAFQKALRTFFEEHPQVKEVVSVPNFTTKKLHLFPFDPSKKILFDNAGQEIMAKIDEKDDLKAYETPSPMLDLTMKLLVDEAFLPVIKSRIARSIIYRLENDERFKEYILRNMKQAGKKAVSEKLANIYFHYNSLVTSGERPDMLEVALRTKGVPADIADLLVDLSKISTYQGVLEFAKKNDVTDADLSIPLNVFDPQAGSGREILKLFDKYGIDGRLLGTELRQIENDDPRYRVLTGINFAAYADTIKQVLERKNIAKAVENTFFWLNPPYTADDYIARESVSMLPPGVIVAGLFPVKMKNFLLKEIDGHAFLVSRDVTGYEDPKTPEHFLFVVGKKKDAVDEAFKRESGYDEKSGYLQTVESFEKYVREHATDFRKTLAKFGTNSMVYYSSSQDKRRGIVENALVEAVEKRKEFLERIDLVEELINEKKERIFDSMLPTSVAENIPVFPDLRFYSDNGVYQKLSFYEIAGNVSLLEYYRNNVPTLFSIVKRIAERNGTRLPVDGDKRNEIFDLENPRASIGSKERVTSRKLGMMRLYYYPSAIDLSTPGQKRIFLGLVERALERIAAERVGAMSQKSEGFSFEDDTHGIALQLEEAKERVAVLVEAASRVVVKNDKAYIAVEDALANKDIFVFIDEYGTDLGKLDLQITDIYREMEEQGLFKLEDAIELAELSREQKEIAVDNFFEYFDGVLKDVYLFSHLSEDGFDEFKAKTIAEGLSVIADLRKGVPAAEVSKRILAWAKENDFHNYFESRFILPNTAAMIERNIEDNLYFLDEQSRRQLADFLKTRTNGRIIAFFEREKEEFVHELRQQLKPYFTNPEIEAGFEEFVIRLNDDLSEEYSIKSAIVSSYSKLADFFLKEFAYANALRDNGVEKAAIFDKVIAKMFTKRFGLKQHQVEEALRYAAISDEKRLEMLFWEMRSGKTRAMIAIGFMLALLKKRDINLILETANMPDITEQMFESFPFLIANVNFYVGDDKKIDFLKKDNIFNNFDSMEIYPNIAKILQPYLIGKGDTANELKKRVLRDYERIMATFKDKGFDWDTIVATYKDNKFCGLLDVCGQDARGG